MTDERTPQHIQRPEQTPGQPILEDLAALSGQSQETINQSMTKNWGDDWETQVEAARQANLDK